LVVAVSDSYVTTIEGNTSDMVAKRTYRLSDPNIFGYGRPRWGTPDSGTGDGKETNVPTTPQKPAEEPKHLYNVKLPLLMIGDKGPYVIAVQALLIARGYDCGNKPFIGVEKPDGDFGRATERAVGFFQSKCELPDIDGEVGGDTWRALLSKWG
jgi:peptidoglycan hydrolase-like protein with peptidoglycan-binding domain